MKAIYKGFEINAERKPSMGGDELLYFYVMRQSDLWFLIDNFTTGEDTEDEYIGYLKESVDDYLQNPQDWEEVDHA